MSVIFLKVVPRAVVKNRPSSAQLILHEILYLIYNQTFCTVLHVLLESLETFTIKSVIVFLPPDILSTYVVASQVGNICW